MRRGEWIRTEGMELTGKTLGLLGFGGIAAEVARIAAGSGMRVMAWNRSPKSAPGVTFVDLDTLLAESDVLSVHLLLTDETRGFLECGAAGEAAAGCGAGEHGARRDRGRGSDDRRAAVGAVCGMRRWMCSTRSRWSRDMNCATLPNVRCRRTARSARRRRRRT